MEEELIFPLNFVITCSEEEGDGVVDRACWDRDSIFRVSKELLARAILLTNWKRKISFQVLKSFW
jgi:hypothetical protein